MRPSDWSLLACYAAADSLKFQTRILRRFDRAPESLPNERRHFDATLFDVEYHRPAGREFGLG